MKNVAFVFAHPDDLAYGASGTALLLSKKFKLHAFCATKGEKGLRGTSESATAAIREKEQRAESKLMEAKLTFLNLIDREVFASGENADALGKMLKRLKPEAVFTLWPSDFHPDHSAISELTRKALFVSDMASVELFFFSAGLGHQTTHFNPEIYVDISGRHERKMEFLRCHKCQNPEDSLAQSAKLKDRFFGAESGCEFAEGFIRAKSSTVQRGNFLARSLG